MVDLTFLQSVSYIAGAIGVCIAATYYVLTLRISQRNQELSLKAQENTLIAQQTALTMQLYQSMVKTGFADDFQEIEREWTWTDYDDFMNKYGRNGEPDRWKMFVQVLAEWEQIGVLINHGSFDPQMLYDFWANPFISFWEKYEPIINEFRTREDAWGAWEYAEDLYYSFKEIFKNEPARFEIREAQRLRKRNELGLKQRPTRENQMFLNS